LSIEVEAREQPRDADTGRFTPATDSGLRATEISSSMDAAVDKGGRPFDAYQRMDRIGATEKPDGTFGSDQPGIKAAAAELVKKRQELEQNAPVVERAYHTGSRLDQPRRPIVETVTAKEAAADLHGARQAENDANNVLKNLSLREKLDLFRQQADAEDRADAIPQPQPEVAQPAPEPTPADGVHPDVRAALQNPHVRAALEQEATAHATARHQYDQAVQMMGNAAWANVMANFPEMQQGNPQQVLEQMRTTNPQRFAEISGHLQRVGQIGAHMQQLRAQQHQEQARQWQSNAVAQDQHYTDWSSTRSAAENKMVKERVFDVLKSYDINPDELQAAWNSNHPWVRSSAFQRMMHDLTVLHVAREAAGHKAPAHVAPVLRPGERGTGAPDNSQLAAAMKAFNADPKNPRLAAKALVARRKAAAGLR
jgi:hypothetical protein